MKKFLLSFFALFLLISAKGQDIKNPVWPGNWPDPTVWQGTDGRYYCMATNPRRLLQSDDLFHWEMSDISPIDEASWERIRGISRNFWAPDVTTVNGQRLLYLSLYNSAEDSNIGVFREISPQHFQFVNLITRGAETGIEDTIDPEVVTDPKTGQVWLFFGSVGGIHRVELTSDGLNLKEGAEYTHVAGLTVHQNPSRSQVYEGSYLHYRNGWWYLFVSSGFFGDHTYQLQVGRSRKLTGKFVNREGKQMTKGYATPVIHSDEGDQFFGPGHCGEIFTIDGHDYIFYHCHNRALRQRQARPMLMQEIKWDKKGWPYVEGGKPL